MKKGFILLCVFAFFIATVNAQTEQPTISVVGLEDSYEIGSPVSIVASIKSDGAVDRLCGISYIITKDNEEIAEFSDYGTLSYTVRLAEDQSFSRDITEGSGNVSAIVTYDSTEYNIGAFTLGIFDTDCVNRNRAITFDASFIQVGNYSVEISLNSCANEDPAEIGTSFIAANCDSLEHFDAVAEICETPTVLFDTTFNIIVVNPIQPTTAPYIEFLGGDQEYNIGESVAVSAELYSNGFLDNLCGVGYSLYKDDVLVTDLTSNGVFSYRFRVQDENDFFESSLTAGSGMLEAEVEYNDSSYTIGAFTLGIFDNYCVDRNRPVDFNLLFTQPGHYKLETNIYTCSNGGNALGTTYVAENCDGLVHYDRIAETCDNPTSINEQSFEFDVLGDPIYTITTSVVGGHGQVDPLGTFVVNAQDTVSVSFIPDANYEVDQVFVNGILKPITNNTYVFENVNKSYVLTVSFKDVRKYYTLQAELQTAGGNITPRDTTVVEGSDVTFNISIDEGYYISQLTIDEGIIANFSGSEITFSDIQADHVIAISFFPSSVENELIKGLSIYPNPNNGKFNIAFDDLSGTMTYQMFNLSGSVIDEKTLNVDDLNNIQIDNEFSAGTYFLRIIAGDKVVTEKIVIE